MQTARRTRWASARARTVLGAAVALVLVAGLVPAQAGTDLHGEPAPGWSRPLQLEPQPPLRPTSVTQVRPRLTEVTFRTPNLPGTTTVRVLLPAGYDARRRGAYPVLYLLDGCCNASPQARDWTTPATRGDAESITAGRDLITVMPDAGMGGMYTDWVRPGLQGRPQWERYLVGQLLPWVERTYRARTDRGGRAVAGLSMGGFGAMSLAARHPDLFSSASSFSGIVDSNVDPAFVMALTALDGGLPDSAFGSRATEEVLWRASNPVDLAGNLRDLAVHLYTGNGKDDVGLLVDPNEANVHAQTRSLDAALSAAGVPHHLDDYGAGTHSWPFWNRDLRDVLPRVMAAFGPPSDPASFTYTSAEPRYTVHGYEVRVRRDAREFSVLADVTRRGFRLAGTGVAHVRTAPRYVPGEQHRVRYARAGRSTTTRLKADATGRLSLAVPLCTSNSDDQFVAATGPRRTCSTAVAIDRV